MVGVVRGYTPPQLGSRTWGQQVTSYEIFPVHGRPVRNAAHQVLPVRDSNGQKSRWGTVPLRAPALRELARVGVRSLWDIVDFGTHLPLAGASGSIRYTRRHSWRSGRCSISRI